MWFSLRHDFNYRAIAIKIIIINNTFAPFVDVCVRLCMGGVYVIGTILKKEH